MITRHPRLAYQQTLLLSGLFCLLSFATSLGHYPDVLDVVTLAVKPTCANRQALASLNQYLFPKPRTIHVVASTGCQAFNSFAVNVVCHEEDKLVRGIIRENVTLWLEARFKGRPEGEMARVTKRATWFFQQLVKLGVAAHIPGLSEHFLIYDSDMIALRPMTWFLPVDSTTDSFSGSGHVRDQPSVQLPPEAGVNPTSDSTGDHPPVQAARRTLAGEPCVNPFPFRTLIHVGGWAPKYGYMGTHQNLTGSPILRGHDGKSLVTHNMLVYRPFMAQFLGNITAAKYAGNDLGWALSVLDAVAALPDIGEVMVGFSEYWSYLSWVQEHYPCTVVQAAGREWTRTPAYQPKALDIAVKYNGTSVSICCPTARNLAATTQQGYLFTGFELGHVAHCNYHHEAFKDGYAQWYMPT